jgi:hypothetical protein
MRRAASCLLLCLAIATPVYAEQKEPIGRFALDLRGLFARHKKEPTVAEALGVETANLPTRSFGLVAGAHVYPFRAGKITFGFGGEVAVARGSHSLDIATVGDTTTKTPPVHRHFTSFAPEVSLNFGHGRGWSYISGGMFGRSKLYAEGEEKAATAAAMRSTVNYGGGARWFFKPHLAFSVDVRWYSIAEGPAAVSDVVPRIIQPKTTLLVISGGISLK